MNHGVENANARTVHKFLKNFSNDTDMTQEKFISQLVIQDETCIHHFDSESEEQSMQWNERIGQIVFFLHCVTPVISFRLQMTTVKVHKIFIAKKKQILFLFSSEQNYVRPRTITPCMLTLTSAKCELSEVFQF